MIPFSYNSDETIKFIIDVNGISKKFNEIISYDKLRRINKEELFEVIKKFYREVFPELNEDLSKILSMDAKGYIDRSGFITKRINNNIKYMFAKEHQDSISNSDLSAEIYLVGNISDYFTLAHQYMHLIGYYNHGINNDLIEVEGYYIEKLLGEYLVYTNIITKEEQINLERLRANRLNDSVKYCNSIVNGIRGDTDVFTKCMKIIYGEIFGTLIYRSRDGSIKEFKEYIKNKNIYNSIDAFIELFNLDSNNILTDYKKHINMIGEDNNEK